MHACTALLSMVRAREAVHSLAAGDLKALACPQDVARAASAVKTTTSCCNGSFSNRTQSEKLCLRYLSLSLAIIWNSIAKFR